MKMRSELENELHIIRAGLACAPSATTNTAACGALVRLGEALEADARALWSVRVLDAKGSKRGAPAAYWYDEGLPDYWGWFHPWMPDGASTVKTPDAARLAAAQAVYQTLPTDVRAELGECP
jgi:hypothetical protein